jgi:hypothetical protein
MSPRAAAVSNVELLTYVVALLGGIEAPVHLETVAVRAFELMPGAFRWDLDGFKTYIDKDKVRASLTDAEKASHGHLVRAVGTTKAGQSKKTDYWQLTRAGSDWLVQNGKRIAEALGAPQPGLKKGRAREIRERIVNSPLYERFARGGGLSYSPYEFADLLECSPDASNRVVAERFEALQSQVRQLGERDLDVFLGRCQDAHRRMLEV